MIDMSKRKTSAPVSISSTSSLPPLQHVRISSCDGFRSKPQSPVIQRKPRQNQNVIQIKSKSQDRPASCPTFVDLSRLSHKLDDSDSSSENVVGGIYRRHRELNDEKSSMRQCSEEIKHITKHYSPPAQRKTLTYKNDAGICHFNGREQLLNRNGDLSQFYTVFSSPSSLRKKGKEKLCNYTTTGNYIEDKKKLLKLIQENKNMITLYKNINKDLERELSELEKKMKKNCVK